ncbi:WD repeat-containing protein on Y chromosome-like [Adelges cooleyi]|uniref:WD repeat-containing protein on Y chromosome-like n=1 Tax=Adelges cooleyi TaxID=133065 RepID=UPI00217F2367|nr:WD repeat-containing protein on Y chromosome-like [Adelges cooleyi]
MVRNGIITIPTENTSVGNDEPNEELFEPTIKKIFLGNIVKNISKELVFEIRQRFYDESSTGSVTEKQLRAVLEPYDLKISDENFRAMFAKMDLKKEGFASFLQFVAYVAVEFEAYRRQFDIIEFQPSNQPVVLILDKPVKIVNKHRRPIVGVAFKPLLGKDTVSTFVDGEYVTASLDGMISFWTLDMKWKKIEWAPSRNDMFSTKLTALVVLPDLNIVGVSTAENELRFYDTLADQFRLRVVIENLPHIVTCFSYYYKRDADPREFSSRLMFGDYSGGVRILSMMTRSRGPFRMISGDGYVIHDYTILRAKYKAATARVAATLPFHVLEFPDLHTFDVLQVEFCDNGTSIVSVSESATRSMVYFQAVENGWMRWFASPLGYSCVCTIANTHLVTGSRDCVVRVWSIESFQGTSATTKQRSINFTGHNAPIMHVFYNNNNKRLYSICADRTINVWSVHQGTCLMTYTGLIALRPDFKDVSILFNQSNNTLIMGSRSIVVLPCGENINQMFTDGYSHNAAVVKTLYNKLYRILVSVSADSVISVWNLWSGALLHKTPNAHTKQIFGETVPAEITAANFDPSGGLLVTGAENGTIRMWDPTNGTCLNKLSIASRGQISEIIWLPNKVLVSSWDRRITEFNDPLLVSKGKLWLVKHEEAILTMCVKLPSTLVTTSYGGKIGFWRLETGQQIKTYPVKMKPDSKATSQKNSMASKSVMSSGGLSSMQYRADDSRLTRTTQLSGMTETREARMQRLGVKYTPREYFAAACSHFLRGREDGKRIGTLLIATRNGVVQIWSTYKIPAYVAQFKAIHEDGDYVTSMASDDKSKYLFTCFTTGYIKVWYIVNFGVIEKQYISMPLLRLRFPFLIYSFFVGRAERSVQNLDVLLISSYQGHLAAVRHIEYVQHIKLVVTSSSDMSVRLWTINGHYIGTLGTAAPWPRLDKSNIITVYTYRLPPDIKRVASSTTLQVMMNGVNSVSRSTRAWERLKLLKQQRDMENKEVRRKLQGNRCPKQPLHNHYSPSTMVVGESSDTITKVEYFEGVVRVNQI